MLSIASRKYGPPLHTGRSTLTKGSLTMSLAFQDPDSSRLDSFHQISDGELFHGHRCIQLRQISREPIGQHKSRKDRQPLRSLLDKHPACPVRLLGDVSHEPSNRSNLTDLQTAFG